MSFGLRPCGLQGWAVCDGNCEKCQTTATTHTLYNPIEIARQYAPKFDKPVVDMVEVVRVPIKGYEGSYEVDQFGRVFALDRTVRVDDNGRVYDKPIKARQLKQGVHSKGYKIVTLTKDGVSKTVFVHRLVAEAFIPNDKGLPYINHIDEDKTNNFVENLEWCTAQYNSTYGKAKQKQAAKLVGRPLSEEHKRKIAEGVKRFYKSRGERKEDADSDTDTDDI